MAGCPHAEWLPQRCDWRAYFCTANLLDRNSRLLAGYVNLMHGAVRDVRARNGLRWRMALRLCALRGLSDQSLILAPMGLKPTLVVAA